MKLIDKLQEMMLGIEREKMDNVTQYLIKSYQSSISYFNGFAQRIATRFNILLTINVVCGGFYANIWIEGKANSKGVIILPILGLFIALSMYIQSAQDKFIYVASNF